MTMKLNKQAFEQLVREDIEWLREQPNCLERRHIEDILEWCVDVLYPENEDN